MNRLARKSRLARGSPLCMFVLSASCCSLIGCVGPDPHNNPFLQDATDKVTLESNLPDTHFYVRLRKVDADPDAGWEPVGQGQNIKAALRRGGRYEIKAVHEGYEPKKCSLTEAIPRVAFEFLNADRIEPTAPTPPVGAAPVQTRPPPATPPSYARPHGLRWAVIVGISDYLYPGRWGLSNLRYAARDGQTLADFLKSPEGGRFDHVILLTDKEATLNNVKVALREELRAVQKSDLVVIFWSGHGTPDPHEPNRLYLVAHDTDPAHLASTAYGMDEFQNDVGRIQAQNVIILADACHSAGISDPKLGFRGPRDNPIVEGLRAIGTGPSRTPTTQLANRAIFTSCETGELSREYPDLDGGHGVFTYYLLKGWRGAADERQFGGDANSTVTLGEVIEYTRDRVKRHTGNQQHPDTAGAFDRELPLAVAR